MSNLEGITLSTGEHAYAGINNSFLPKKDPVKQKILAAAIAVMLLLDSLVLVNMIGFLNPEGSSDGNMSLDLGDFKPRARKAPVVEIDEVFGNQFVKEKKDTAVLPANEAGGTIDGEGVVDLDVDGGGSGGNAPNIGRCAVKNFPAEAKGYVEEANVEIEITADKEGIIRIAKPLYASFPKTLPPEVKDRMKTLFLNAARSSLLGRRCPLHVVAGQPRPYKMQVPLQYILE